MTIAKRQLEKEIQELEKEVELPTSFPIKWTIKEISVQNKNEKILDSPKFDVPFHGNHKLYVTARTQGDMLGLDLFKDVEMSDDKGRLNIGGTSFIVTKTGLPDKKITFTPDTFLGLTHWGMGFSTFLADMTRYIDNGCINLTVDIKLTKMNVLKWRIIDIAAKLRKAAVDKYLSPKFDVRFRGNHKLFIHAEIQGNKLGLYLHKDIATSGDKDRLKVGGTSFTVTKAGLPDTKRTFNDDTFLGPSSWGRGWSLFLADMTPYIDNDGIDVTVDIKLSKDDEPPMIL